MMQMMMLQKAQNALKPYYTAGQSMLPTLENLLTPGKSAAALAQMPGYQFQQQMGNLATTNQLAAQGLGGSGGPLGVALSNYNQGLAGTYYMNSVNALQNFANMGAGAAGNFGNIAAQVGGQLGQSAQNGANALAAGQLGQANALAGGINSLGNMMMQGGGIYAALNAAPTKAPAGGWV